MLRQQLWQRLASLKANQVFVDAPATLKLAAVNRELRRDLWAYDTPVAALPEPSTMPDSGAQSNLGAATAHPLAPQTNGGHL